MVQTAARHKTGHRLREKREEGETLYSALHTHLLLNSAQKQGLLYLQLQLVLPSQHRPAKHAGCTRWGEERRVAEGG